MGGIDRPDSQGSAEAHDSKHVSYNKRKDAKYDELFYGTLSDIPGFKQSWTGLTIEILQATGGRMKGMKKDDSVLWKPSSRIYTKNFVKRFPKLN